MYETLDIAHHPLPALLVLWPLLCAVAVYPLGRWRPVVRDWFVVFAVGTTLLGSAALIPLVAADHRIATDIPLLVGRLTFVVDPFGMLFALFASFVWFCATLHSLDYLHHEKHHDRYHTVSLIVLAAMLGVVLAGDLVTLYLFFEMLGLVAFLFVIHTQTQEAKRSAIKYFWMTVMGGFALIGGIFLTFALGGDGSLMPLPLAEHSEVLRWVTFGLLVGGFGVKAGMLPLHVWLPDAHPVAPAPASALLSGVMIKAGAYGIFRTVTALFRPELVEDASGALWAMTGTFGLVVLWIGVATMAIGVTMALGQHNAKRMLAYHSVSQMGFILVGIGAAGYLGTHEYAAMGIAGGLFHVVNHALFKAALFLGIGAVVYRTGQLDMYKLGGLWHKMPLTFVFMLIAAAGITGVPLFNGFVSKCLIHHALVASYEVGHMVSLDIAEKIFILTCGGTACSFIKLIGLVFLGKAKEEYGPEVTDAPPRMLIALGLLSAAIITLGVRPHLLLKNVFEPGIASWALYPGKLDYYLENYFLSTADLMSVVIAFAIGATIFVVGMKFGLFHVHAPAWFGVDYWYRSIARWFVAGCGLIQGWYERYLAALSRTLRAARLGYRSTWSRTSRNWQRFVVTVTTGAPGPRNQHFIRNAYIKLARERQSAVRTAVTQTHEWLRAAGHTDDPERVRATVEAVRDIASYITQRQLNLRMNVIADMVRTGEIEATRHVFEDVVNELRQYRTHITHAALELAGRRMAGEDVLREISATVNSLASEERFDRRLRDAAATVHPGMLHIQRLGEQGRDLIPSAASLGGIRSRGLGRLEHGARYGTEMLRLIVEATTQERSTTFVSDRVDPASVTDMRRRIQRYARDMNLNMAMIVIVFLVFMLSIALGGSR